MAIEGPKAVSSQLVYQNKWMRVREDALVYADGSSGIYGVVDKPDFALILPVHADKRIQLVEQYRYPVGARFWECPQGSWEGNSDVAPEVLAQGELQEETGFAAARMRHIGHLHEAYGFCNQGFHVFLATDLSPAEARRDMQEQDMRTAAFALADVKEMIATGAIKDAPTIAAIALLTMSGDLYW